MGNLFEDLDLVALLLMGPVKMGSNALLSGLLVLVVSWIVNAAVVVVLAHAAPSPLTTVHVLQRHSKYDASG